MYPQKILVTFAHRAAALLDTSPTGASKLDGVLNTLLNASIILWLSRIICRCDMRESFEGAFSLAEIILYNSIRRNLRTWVDSRKGTMG